MLHPHVCLVKYLITSNSISHFDLFLNFLKKKNLSFGLLNEDIMLTEHLDKFVLSSLNFLTLVLVNLYFYVINQFI